MRLISFIKQRSKNNIKSSFRETKRFTRFNLFTTNRHISESRRLISGVTEIAKIKKLEGFLVVMDIEKAFDSLDHNF